MEVIDGEKKGNGLKKKIYRRRKKFKAFLFSFFFPLTPLKWVQLSRVYVCSSTHFLFIWAVKLFTFARSM